MKQAYSVVLAEVYNNSTNVLFMMTRNDVEERNGIFPDSPDNYIIQEDIKSLVKGGINASGLRYRVATTTTGKQYEVYSDHSMVKINS